MSFSEDETGDGDEITQEDFSGDDEDGLSNENLSSSAPMLNKKKSRNDDGEVRKVFIVHKGISKADWGNVTTMLLPHPKTQGDTLFLFDTRGADRNGMHTGATKHFVYEVLTMAEEDGLSSWFIGDSVASHGVLYVFTPVDPLFLILPAISTSSFARPLMDHLIDYFPSTFAKVVLLHVVRGQLLNICLEKVSGDIEAYVFDEQKTLQWLTRKVKAVAQFFSDANLTRSESSISINFNPASETEPDKVKRNDEYIHYGFDLAAEYLSDTLKTKLHKSLGIPNDTERIKRKNTETEGESKRLKMETAEGVMVPLEDYGSAASDAKSSSKVPATTKQKQLQHAAKGTHSLLKFFTPKPKK